MDRIRQPLSPPESGYRWLISRRQVLLGADLVEEDR